MSRLPLCEKCFGVVYDSFVVTGHGGEGFITAARADTASTDDK
jgi:hypothetical protein